MSFDNEGEQLVQSNPGDEVQTPSRGSKKWIGSAAAAAVVVALTVGGVTLMKAMGGGAQPEDVLPANAIAFAKIDVNPSAGQKLAVFQLASKFPKVKEKIASPESSLKEAVFGSFFTGSGGEEALGLDFKKDIEPWLGDRIGVGVFPDSDGDKNPEFGVAVAYTDQNAAKVALDKGIANEAKRFADLKAKPPGDMPMPELPAEKSTPTGYAFADGYVILSDTTAHATALVAAGKSSPLARSTYAEDVKSLGSDQIGVAWADIAAIVKAIPKDPKADPFGLLKGVQGAQDPSMATGRVVMGLHADASYVEITGKGIDVKGVDTMFTAGPRTEAGLISSFPSEVFGAVTITGLGKAAGALYTSLTTAEDAMGIKSMLSEAGIGSAKEIETLLGDETGIMVGGTTDNPQFAIRTRSKDADAALVIANKALGVVPAGQMSATAARKITGPDGIVVSMGSGLTKSLFDKSGPKLAGSEAFRQALPDADKADMAGYVDVTKAAGIVWQGGSASSQGGSALSQGDTKSLKEAETDWLKPIASFGATATSGNEPTFRFRLTVK
jgi:Protein of unknown function (DUF3352)